MMELRLWASYRGQTLARTGLLSFETYMVMPYTILLVFRFHGIYFLLA
jgi:hypothetical protein